MRCPNCDSQNNEFLLVDCALPLGEARDRLRYCHSCKPEALHELAGYAPRMLARMGLPAEVLRAALAARRYVADKRQSYPLAQRIADLAGPVNPRIN